jgi:hypothetical protein
MQRRLLLPPLAAAAVAAVAASSLLVASASASRPRTVCPSGCAFTTIPAALAAASPGDTIAVGPGSYGGGFTISQDVTLRGAGAGLTTISGTDPGISCCPQGTVTVASGAVVKITGVTIGRFSQNGTNGLVNRGTLTLKESTVRDASAVFGGGILNSGVMTLQSTLVTHNFADVGGGIWNSGTMTLDDSVVTANGGSGLSGGGILNLSTGTLRLNDSTVTDNHVDPMFGTGGGIDNMGTVRLDDSTVTGNTPSDCVGC